MRKAIFLALTCATLLPSCKKECAQYQTLVNNECQNWNAKFARTWHNLEGESFTCTNGSPFSSEAPLYAGSAPNKVKVDDQVEITLVSETRGMAGPIHLEYNGEPYTLHIELKYFEGTGNFSGGVYVGGTPAKITYSLWIDKDTPNEIYCYGEYY